MLVLLDLVKCTFVSMVAESPLNRTGLPRVLLGNSNHRFHTFGRHEHLVETEESVFKSFGDVLLTLKFRLLLEFGFKELLTKLGAFQTSVAVENRKQSYTLFQIGVLNMGILLYKN